MVPFRVTSPWSPAPVVCTPEKPDWPVLTYPGELIAHDNLIEVMMVPTGFMRINRAVFEYLDVPSYANPGGDVLWRPGGPQAG